jgi:hypothetical protein
MNRFLKQKEEEKPYCLAVYGYYQCPYFRRGSDILVGYFSIWGHFVTPYYSTLRWTSFEQGQQTREVHRGRSFKGGLAPNAQ